MHNVVNTYWRKQKEKEAFDLSLYGYKIEGIKKYKQLVMKYPKTGYNWFLYARQLYYSNRLPEALESLNECRKYYVDNSVYKLKADIEYELNNYKTAEKNYLRAIYMVPNRMGSRFDLLNFYIARKDTTNAIYWANSILNMPVKVVSEKTENMQKVTKEILYGLQH
jgi:tetratricopeptide (TPR) repeat protein